MSASSSRSTRAEPEVILLTPVPDEPKTSSRPPQTSEGVRIGMPEPVQAFLRHPLVLAGGALAAGTLGGRIFMTAGGRRIASELAKAALKRAAPLAGTAAAGTLLDRGFEKIRPHAAQYAKKMLAEMLRKKE